MAKVAVIGAGFVGLSSAYWLMRDGHQVTVFDPAGAAGGASFGNAGTFANYACIPVNNPGVFGDLPRYLLASDSPFRLRWRYLPQLAPWLAQFLWHSMQPRYESSVRHLSALLARAQEGYDSMIGQAQLQSWVRPRECLYLYSSARSFDASRASLALRREGGVQCDELAAADIARLEPQLAPLFAHGVLYKNSWHLSDPQGFLRQLQRWLQAAGLQMLDHAVTRIEPQAQGVVLRTQQTSSAQPTPTRHDLQFDYVAVCAGVHSRELARQCGDALPLKAERGYHLMYPGASPLVSRPVGWAERGFYMTPMAQGLRVAGTVELAGLKPEHHPGLLNLLHYASQRALPALKPFAPQGEGKGTGAQSLAALTPWLGFRPTLPDGLPVLGRSKASHRVIYAFGHQHIGLTLGGLSGMVVSDLVAGRQATVDISACSPGRFE